MNQKFEFEKPGPEAIVYVRPLAAIALPQEVRDQTGNLETVYAVHDKDGQQLAIVSDRKAAFALARQYDFLPVNAH